MAGACIIAPTLPCILVAIFTEFLALTGYNYGSQLLSVHITSRTITSCTLFYTEIFCLMLPPLESGQIDYSPDMTDPFEFNSRASHVCEEGYFLEGNQVRSCSGDGLSTIGNWNGETPICTGRYVCIRVKWCTDKSETCPLWLPYLLQSCVIPS